MTGPHARVPPGRRRPAARSWSSWPCSSARRPVTGRRGERSRPRSSPVRPRRDRREPVSRRLADRSRPRPAHGPPHRGTGSAVRARAIRVRGPAPPRRAGRLRPRAPSRASLHGGDRPGSVTARSVFLVRLVAGPAEVTGVDRLVWDPVAFTLYARPDTLLEPETRYGLVVTRDVRDVAGRPVEPSPAFAPLLRARRRFPPPCASIGSVFACSGRPSSGGVSDPTGSRPRPSSPPGASRRSSSTPVTPWTGGRRPPRS